MRVTRFFPGFTRTVQGCLVLTVALAGTACSMSNKAKGTGVGVAAGAAAGGVIGNQTGSTARGAIIGAVIGGAAGAIIGHQMDQQAKELEVVIPGAVVQRVGEGLVVTFPSGLLYDFDSDAIRAEAGRNLRELAVSLKKYASTDLLIVGHTDALGSTEYNQSLSMRRASAASRYLAMEGINSNRLHTTGKGELEAVSSNGTEAGRQQNRRIEVAIYASEAMRTRAQ
jgi:outer membrane protein OmpA-like peptidoglycan-associated protein